MLAIMIMPFLIMLCYESVKENKPVIDSIPSPDDYCYHYVNEHLYRDEPYRNVYIDMGVLMLMCDIVDERLDC